MDKNWKDDELARQQQKIMELEEKIEELQANQKAREEGVGMDNKIQERINALEATGIKCNQEKLDEFYKQGGWQVNLGKEVGSAVDLVDVVTVKGDVFKGFRSTCLFRRDNGYVLFRKHKEIKLFIDDIRNPKLEGFDIVRSSKEAISFMVENGCPAEISFDHDLGGEDTSMIVVKWMIDEDLNLREEGRFFIPQGFKFNVHSANPVGSQNIQGLMDGYLKSRDN